MTDSVVRMLSADPYPQVLRLRETAVVQSIEGDHYVGLNAFEAEQHVFSSLQVLAHEAGEIRRRILYCSQRLQVREMQSNARFQPLRLIAAGQPSRY